MSISKFSSKSMDGKPKLYVCKPSKETVGHVDGFYNATFTIRFGALNTINFTIPAEIFIEKKLQQNPLVHLLKERYLIRMELSGETEYFVIMKTNKFMEQDGFESISYQCYSLGVQITNSLIRNYEETANLSGHVKHMLEQTNWKLDYVDVDFDMSDREYQMSSGNALQCIFDLCEKFNAIVVFNTLKRTVNFHKPQNVGKNRGLRMKKGKYLESFNIDIDAEAMVTRLFVYGADGLDLRRVLPTGSDYIEDYSFYLYPFQHDGNYNVIKKSKYMSDSLCIAILKYNAKLESLQGEFDRLVTEATAKREALQKKNQELSVATAKRNDLLNQRDVINYTYKDDAPNHWEWQDVIARLNTVDGEISALETVISSLTNELETILNRLEAISNDVATENNFTPEQVVEWADYWHGKEHYNDSIIDDEDLLKEAKEVFDELRQPPVSLTLSVEDFAHHFEYNLDYDKLNIGDLLTLESKSLAITVTAKITEITMNFDGNSVNITVANTESYNSDFDKFVESLNLTISTSTQVNLDKYKVNRGDQAYDEISEYLNNALDAAQQLIQGGLNGSVTLSERGLVSVDMLEKSTWLMITNGTLLITPDNGNHVSVAIDKNGVHAERLVGRLILGNKLIISDEKGQFTIVGNLLTVKDADGKVRVKLGEYKPGKYGLQLFSKDGNQVVLDEDGMLQTWQEGRTDNVDYNEPIELNLFIPKETISIRRALLRFKILQFRSYSRTTSSLPSESKSTWDGGGEAATTEDGGRELTSTRSGGGTAVTSGAPKEMLEWGTSETREAAGHKHILDHVTSHAHRVEIQAHTHEINLPAHAHKIYLPNHSHRFEIPGHSHDIEPGIFKGSEARNITIFVNGTRVGETYNSDRDDIDISSALQKGMYNKIELFSTQLGRIDATVFAQVMMGFE